MITMSAASGQRVAEVLEEESTLKNPERPVFEIADGSIDFEGVTFRYDENAKKEGKLKAGMNKAMRKNGLDKKINRWYMQAGMEGKTYEDFVYSNLKYVAFGIIGGFLSYVIFGNLIISAVVLLLFSCLHVLDIFGSIREV